MTLAQRLRPVLAYPPLKGSVLLLGAALLVLTLVFVSWVPAHYERNALQRRQVVLAEQRAQLLAEMELSRLVLAQHALIMDIRQKLAANTPPADMMAQIQALADSCDIHLIEHRSPEETGLTGTERYLITAEGNYAGIRRFLAELPAKSPRLTTIKTVRLGKALAGSLVHAEIELVTYTLSGRR